MPSAAKRIPRVLVSEVEGFGDWYRRILHGVAWYASTGPQWEVRVVRALHKNLEGLSEWEPDGIIAVVPSTDPADRWVNLPCPVVSAGGLNDDPRLHAVMTDEHAVGRLAAEHLLERRFRNFAFVGFAGNPASAQRRDGFLAGIAAAGISTDAVTPSTAAGNRPTRNGQKAKGQKGNGQALVNPAELADPGADPAEHAGEHEGEAGTVAVLETEHQATVVPLGQVQPFENALLEWVDHLPRPVAIMGWNDLTALLVMQCCRALQISIPEQAAVIGVDDDETWCGLALPPLSSVRTPQKRIGFHAAAMLDRMMSGSKPDEPKMRFQPEGVQRRKSTDILAVDDPLVAEALRYVRENVRERLSVSDVVSAVAVSRRLLEVRFRETLGRSILDEIHRAQLQVAEQLLRSTEVPIRAIALRSGFRDVNHLTRAFSKNMGVPPAAYRKQSRLA